LGFVAGFLISALLGVPAIRILARSGVRQTVSEDAPSRHSEKQGTPTMGGLLILAGLTVPVLFDLLVHPEHLSALALLGLTLGFGAIGFLDDFLIATRGRNLGLRAREKLALQFAVAAAFIIWLAVTAVPLRTTVVRFWTDIELGTAYYVLGVLLIVGVSNAVNFLDGLDGLAAGVCAQIALALALTAYAGHGLDWLPLFGGAVAGGAAGFLWYNAHPAQLFMGDTGSLALGAALAGMAMIGKVEVPFQFYSFVPWAALFSVLIQVSVFKYRTRRYGLEYARANRAFRRTPIHHHFEELGWPETRIVARFWIATAIAIAVTVAVIGR